MKLCTGQKGELMKGIITVSQVYAPNYGSHETWNYKKNCLEIVGYIFSVTVEKSVTGYCWKVASEEWALLT